MGTKQFDNYADLITFTRASGGTALRPISYGSELVTNGTFDSDSDWTKEGTWAIAAGVASHGLGNNHDLYQQVNMIAGNTYIISFDIANRSVGTVSVRYNGNVILSGQPSGSPSFTFTADATNLNLEFRALNNFDGDIDNISVKEILFDQPNAPLTLFNHPTNTPRIEYDADGTRLGLLVEEQRTNLLTYSEDFSTGQWSNRNVTLTTGQASPDGQNSATLVTSSTTDVANGLNITGFSGSTGLTYSCFAKKGSTNWLSINPVSGVVAYFDLDNGVKGTATGCVSEIQDVGNGWYRCSAYLAGAFGSNGRLVVSDSDNTQNATTGNSIYIWGAQIEAGSFPTSYIPTSGSTATRAADVASIPTSAFGYNASEGTVVAEYENTQNEKSGFIWSLEDGTSDERIYGIQRVNQAGSFAVTDNGSTQADITSGSGSLSQPLKIASAYKINDFAHYLSGSQVGTDSSGAIPSVNSLYIGLSSATPDFPRNGHIKSIKYYPRRLTNAQLVELTS